MANAKNNKSTAGLKTVRNLLLTALEPVGTTMYIYGGGWNEEDTAAGADAVTIGVSPVWKNFYEKQNSSYNYKQYDFRKDVGVKRLGLDCSGYVGWVIYNTLNTESGKDGFVTSARKIAASLSDKGWGQLAARGSFSDYQAGDIMSASCSDCAHVWICMGQCTDQSVVLLHSSPCGVMLSGTYTANGSKSSEAVALATEYMKKYYPDWISKYPRVERNTSYLSHYDRFRWELGIELTDPDELTQMGAENVLKNIFNEL